MGRPITSNTPKAIYLREWRAKNPDKTRADMVKRDKAKIAARSKERYAIEPEFRRKTLEAGKLWCAKNPEKRAESKRLYGIAYRPKRRAIRNAQHKERYANDPAYQILLSLRTRLHKTTKNALANKVGRTMDLLGCSMGRFMDYLASQFSSGMNFNNYGKWHIDHKRPCASFDLTQPEEQAKCFNWLNLQPLWALDNLRKSDNIPVHASGLTNLSVAA